MIALAVLAIVLLAAAPAHAQTGANVAVVINENSADSVRIGEYYAQKRQLPAENVFRIKTAPDEVITRATYASEIEAPISKALTARALQDQVLYIVLTKGVPLRIIGTAGRSGTAASVDSELTLLYRRMTGQPIAPAGSIDNPYYLGDSALTRAEPFSHRAQDIFLVTRLDAFSADEAVALVDRALASVGEGAVVLDQRAEPQAAIGDRWMTAAARAVAETNAGRPVLLEPTRDGARPDGRVLAYYSWGSADRALRTRALGFQFAPGSIAATLTSTDARTFAAPPGEWSPSEIVASRSAVFAGSAQSLLGDLLREGVTGAAGNVAEPYLQSVIRPQVLFPAYLSGFNLAEAFYLAMPHLSWQTVIVGDPLCRPFRGANAPSSDLEVPIDPTAGVPRRFLERRLQVLREEAPAAPKEALLYIVSANTRTAAGDRPGTKQALSQAMSLWPDNAGIRLQLAVLHGEDGQFDQAMEGYRRVLELQPRNVVALNNLAYALATRDKELDEALRLARRAFVLAPDDANVLDTVGWIEHLSGNEDAAVVHLRSAAQKAPDHPEIRLHAASALARAGATDEAWDHLRAALKLESGLAERNDVRSLQQLLKR